MAPSQVSVMLCALCFATSVEAFSTFAPTCSAPNATVNYVSVPDARGTLDILWSCLFAIVACTWTLQHPDVPKQRDERRPSWQWGLLELWRGSRDMVATAFAPEYIVSKACHDLLAARKSHRDHEMRRFAEDDGVEWTLTHAYFANMGGFVVRCEPPDKKDGCADLFHLRADDILELRRKDAIPALPDVPSRDLLDKSKGDSLVKAIAVCEILWVIIQILARLAGGLGVSQLEVAVLAFSVCAVMIYAIYWEKPKRIGTTIAIPCHVTPGDSDWSVDQQRHGGVVDMYLPKPFRFKRRQPQGSPMDFDEVICDRELRCPALWMGATATTVFGGVHILAWNFAFPSTIDRVLWRSASVYTTVHGGLLMSQALLGYLVHRYPDHDTQARIWSVFSKEVLPLLSIVYVIARLIIMIEVFRTLFYLPPSAFSSTWADNLPHFG